MIPSDAESEERLVPIPLAPGSHGTAPPSPSPASRRSGRYTPASLLCLALPSASPLVLGEHGRRKCDRSISIVSTHASLIGRGSIEQTLDGRKTFLGPGLAPGLADANKDNKCYDVPAAPVPPSPKNNGWEPFPLVPSRVILANVAPHDLCRSRSCPNKDAHARCPNTVIVDRGPPR